MTEVSVRRLSVVCPCYRESANIDALVGRIAAVLDPVVEWELVLVDDGSPDDTWARIEAVAAGDSRVRGLRFSRNFGKEAAMLAGLRAAQGDAVVIMDADLQHPPEIIPEMVEAMRSHQVDQVIARRDRTGERWPRRLLSRLYYRIVQALVEVRLEDGVGDFRLLSRRAVDALLSLTEVNRFSKGLFAWIGFRRHVVDYRNVGRQSGASSWGFLSLLNYGIDGVIAFNDRPLRLAVQGGLTAAGLSVLYLLWLIVEWFRHGVTAPGYITIIAAVVLLGGVQLTFIGILGEYIGRIHQEVKERPSYIVADEVNGPASAP